MAADPSRLRYELPGPLFFSFFSFLRSLLSFNLFAFGDGGLRLGVERFCSRPRMELPGGWESWGGGVDAFATICTVCSGRAPRAHLGGHSAKGVVPGAMRVGASPLHSLRRGCIGIEFAELALVQPWVYSGWSALSVALCSQSGWAACTICGRWGSSGACGVPCPRAAGHWWAWYACPSSASSECISCSSGVLHHCMSTRCLLPRPPSLPWIPLFLVKNEKRNVGQINLSSDTRIPCKS